MFRLYSVLRGIAKPGRRQPYCRPYQSSLSMHVTLKTNSLLGQVMNDFYAALYYQDSR